MSVQASVSIHVLSLFLFLSKRQFSPILSFDGNLTLMNLCANLCAPGPSSYADSQVNSNSLYYFENPESEPPTPEEIALACNEVTDARIGGNSV